MQIHGVMQTKQPVWKFVANLGDANPIEYGGLFVYVDETGIYPPEMEKLEIMEETGTWELRRTILEPCTFQNGILSDNKFHPESEAWFADKLESVASFIGQTREEMIADFLSDGPCKRAFAWQAIGDYFGWDNLDAYPLTFDNYAEVEARYATKNA